MTIYEKIKFCLEQLRPVPDNFKESTELLKKWLLKKDNEGYNPEIFITMSNRTGGKTYFIAYLLFDLFRRFGVKFVLYCRTGSELGNVVSGIFSSVMHEFEGYQIEENIAVQNVYSDICVKYEVEEDGKKTIHKDICGYVICLNASDKIKKFSSNFYDVDIIFFDEFQADTYLGKEIDKYVNVHMSIARGSGMASRPVPVIMASNSLTIVNPYFEMFKLTNKIQENTKFLTVPGISLLRFVNNSVAEEQARSRFNIACSSSEQLKSNITNSWLKDNKACVCKPQSEWGRGFYICTFVKKNEKYGMRRYNNNIIYVSRSVDNTCNSIYALDVDGMENIECAKRSLPLQILRQEFLKGNVRFSDLACKYTMLDWI